MIISGLQKTTLLDYPGHVAATLFLGGCNFRCPFCHNMDIVNTKYLMASNPDMCPSGLGEVTQLNSEKRYSIDEIESFLRKRSGVLDGICITGGEPTIYNDLPDFIENVKKIERKNGSALLVKLDTNGTNPKMLKELIDMKLIDYVAMDIKASIEKYALVSGILHDNEELLIGNVISSVSILKESEIDYEFRTTIVKEFHEESDIHSIGRLIKGAKKYYIQSFTDSAFVPDHNLTSLDKDTLKEYREIMKEYVQHVELRGVD